MKRILTICFAVTIFCFSCKSSAQKEAEKTADAIQNTMESFGPGNVATSENGYYMKADIDGKPWTAKSMMEINESNHEFVRGDDGTTQIAFYIDRDHMVVGKPRKFGEGHSADFSMGDDILSAREGEWIITKADDNAIEGTFHFIAKGFQTDKTAEIQNDSFRILLKDN